jgi:hypothetical protein
MKLKDVRVGMKVVPHSKSTGCSFKAFNESQCARRKKDTWLFVIDIEDSGRILLSPEREAYADSTFFLPVDLEQWCDADDAPEGYYAVAQKNCTECDLRGHVECIQARCDESVRGDGCPVIFKQKAQSLEAYDSTSTTVEAVTDYTVRQTEPDPVNNPSHYTNGEIECIDAIKSAITGLVGMEAFCTGQILKYSWRWKHKNGKEDLEKARYYINKLIEELHANSKDN